MKCALQIISGIILIVGILSCKDTQLRNGFYFTDEEPYYMLTINDDTLIFEDSFAKQVYKYKLKSTQKIYLTPIEKPDSTFGLQCLIKQDSLKLLWGDSLMTFRFADYDNTTNKLLDTRGLDINIPTLQKPDFISKQDLVITLFIESKGRVQKLILNNKQTNIKDLRNGLKNALNEFNDYFKPFVVLRVFVDRNDSIRNMTSILKQLNDLFNNIGYVVKPSFQTYKRCESQYYVFFDRFFSEIDISKIKNKTKPPINFHIDSVVASQNFSKKLYSKLKNKEYSYINLIIHDRLTFQDYIIKKQIVNETIDSLRNELDKSEKQETVMIRYPKIIIESIE